MTAHTPGLLDGLKEADVVNALAPFDGIPHGNMRDLSGQTFGRLTVLYRSQDQVQPSGHRTVRWACRCQCGEVKSIPAAHLRRKAVVSCGCQRSDKARSRALDLTGMTFGRLTVLRSDDSSASASRRWLCHCECGNVKSISTHGLQKGTASCGCLWREAITTPGRGAIDSVGYRAAHNRVRTAKGRAASYPCIDCGGTAREWSYNKTDPNELTESRTSSWGEFQARYSLSPDFYEPRCKPCHTRFDLARSRTLCPDAPASFDAPCLGHTDPIELKDTP